METYGQRLQLALSEKGKDRLWLAKKIGISAQALSQVILGKTKALTAENHELAVSALGCSGRWLASGHGVMKPAIKNECEGVSLDQALAHLGDLLANADAPARETAAAILGGLARNPHTASSVCKALAAVLDDCECAPKANRKAG